MDHFSRSDRTQQIKIRLVKKYEEKKKSDQVDKKKRFLLILLIGF